MNTEALFRGFEGGGGEVQEVVAIYNFWNSSVIGIDSPFFMAMATNPGCELCAFVREAIIEQERTTWSEGVSPAIPSPGLSCGRDRWAAPCYCVGKKRKGAKNGLTKSRARLKGRGRHAIRAKAISIDSPRTACRLLPSSNRLFNNLNEKEVGIVEPKAPLPP